MERLHPSLAAGQSQVIDVLSWHMLKDHVEKLARQTEEVRLPSKDRGMVDSA